LKPDAEANRIISDADLIHIDIKELNKMLKERGIAKELSVRLKQRRRTLKNRNYASSCREKKDEEISQLEKLKGEEIDEVAKMEEGNKQIKNEIEEMKRKYQLMMDYAKQNNMEIVS